MRRLQWGAMSEGGQQCRTTGDAVTAANMHDPLVVLHVMRTYGAHGGERQLAQYFSAEPAGGIIEHFAFVYRDPDCVELFGRAGARVTRHNLLPFSVKPRQNPWLEILLILPLLPLLQLRLMALLRRTGSRVCVVHGVQAALVAWPAGLLWRGRTGFVYIHRITKSMGRHPLLRCLYFPYRAFGGVSQAVTRSLAPIAGRNPLVALENGINWQKIERAAHAGQPPVHPNGPVLIAVGRLLPHKRQEILIETFAKLARGRPDLAMWIVGDGPARAQLENAAVQHGVADRVTFWGYRTDVPRLLAAATLFVNASRLEGMSNAVLEAMALGIASVVADAPGVSECHRNAETGLVVDGTVDAMAEAVARLLDDPAQRACLGTAARERIRQVYSIEANRRRFLDLYRSVTRSD